MLTETFREVIGSEEELRELLGQPSELVIRKQLPRLDQHARHFIAKAPFALAGTANADGECDVSPRGDGPGFALVLDDATLVLPERPGNRRADTLRNILQNPQIGLLFVVPNMNETLRVNGTARLIRDADILARMAMEGKPPVLGIAVSVREVFFHCARSFLRGKVWKPEAWPQRSELPTLGRIIADQLPDLKIDAAAADANLEKSNQRLY